MGERKKRERINWNTLKKLGHYLAAERWYLLVAVCLAVAGNLLALAGPMLSGYAVDAISPGPGRVDFERVFYYAKWMIVCYGAAFVCSYSCLLYTSMSTPPRGLRTARSSASEC